MISSVIILIGVIISVCLSKDGVITFPSFSLPPDIILICWSITPYLMNQELTILITLAIAILPYLFYNKCLTNLSSFILSITILAIVLLYKRDSIFVAIWLSYILFITSYSYKER